MGAEHRIREDEEDLRLVPGSRLDGAAQIAGLPRLRLQQLQAHSACRPLGILLVEAEHVRRFGILENRHAHGTRYHLLEELQPLLHEVRRIVGEPRDLPAGAAEAGDEARPDGVAAGNHDDRSGRGRPPRGVRGDVRERRDDIEVVSCEGGRRLRQLVVAALGAPADDLEGLSPGVAQLA